MMQVKPWWQSTSFWMVIGTIISMAIDKLIAGGILPDEGWAVVVASVLGLVFKRGSAENTAIKANAVVEAAKLNPPQG